MKLLLSREAKVDHTCSQGATALCIAAQEGHVACVKSLLLGGADPHHSDRCGRTALRVAAKSGHEEIVRLLEEAAATGAFHHKSKHGGTNHQITFILISKLMLKLNLQEVAATHQWLPRWRRNRRQPSCLLPTAPIPL